MLLGLRFLLKETREPLMGCKSYSQLIDIQLSRGKQADQYADPPLALSNI